MIKQPILFLFVASILMPGVTLAADQKEPTVLTEEPLNVVSNAAIITGRLKDDGGYSTVKVWFEYGEDDSYGFKTEEESAKEGMFQTRITDLEPCTNYYYRAVAKNSKGTSYGTNNIITTYCATPLSIKVTVKELAEKDWHESVTAEQNALVMFKIVVQSHQEDSFSDMMLKNDLPLGLIYNDDLRINDTFSLKDLTKGAVNLGGLPGYSSKTITFQAQVSPGADLNYGINNLINSAAAYSGGNYVSDTARVVVDVTEILAASAVNTGVGANILSSILLPLAIAFVLVWVFKSPLIAFDEWANKRKQLVLVRRAEKKLARIVTKNN